MVGRPRRLGSSRCSTDAKNASTSACRIVASMNRTHVRIRQRRNQPTKAAVRRRVGLGQVLRDPVEEGRPPLPGALVLLARHPAALLEVHLCPAVAEVGEDDGPSSYASSPGWSRSCLLYTSPSP